MLRRAGTAKDEQDGNDLVWLSQHFAALHSERLTASVLRNES
jgi:hypothetical protein